MQLRTETNPIYSVPASGPSELSSALAFCWGDNYSLWGARYAPYSCFTTVGTHHKVHGFM